MQLKQRNLQSHRPKSSINSKIRSIKKKKYARFTKTGKRFRQQSAKSTSSKTSVQQKQKEKLSLQKFQGTQNTNTKIEYLYDMKKKQQTGVSVSTDSMETQIHSNYMIQKTRKTESCTMTKSEVKQEISLADLGDLGSQANCLASSRVFQKQIKLQKERGGQLRKFLQLLNLESFFDKFLQGGYDDMQTAVQITTEQLNYMMMRAQQQDRLMNAIKKVRLKYGVQEHRNPTITNSSSIISKRVRPNSALTTIPSTPSRSRAVEKKITKQTPKQVKFSIPLKSFLYCVGSNEWSVESQIRRACSSCFKVTQDITKKGDCYYCPNCYKFVADDPLSISLSSSMLREYHDH